MERDNKKHKERLEGITINNNDINNCGGIEVR